jgi:hypothetical protein
MLAPNVAGNGPAFSAYSTTNQSISASTWTKVVLQGEEYDTASAFDSTTNYRFQPAVAGYYQFNASLLMNSGGGNYSGVGFNKTGSQFKYSYTSNNSGLSSSLSALIYLNGSTDYVEMYAFNSVGTNTLFGSSQWTFFQGFLVRAA